MTEVTSQTDPESTLKARFRFFGTIIIFVLLCAASFFVAMKNDYRYLDSDNVAPDAVEAQLALERADKIEYLQSIVKVFRDGDETYYLYLRDKSWQTKRPYFLDENDQVFLTPDDEVYLKAEAARVAANNTIVGPSPAWMGFGIEPVTFEENSGRFQVLTAMLWMGFLCSLPLYALLFKRNQFEEAGAWVLTAIGLFILGFLPVVMASSRPTIYAVAYVVPLVSMLLLWRLTREKKVPSTSAPRRSSTERVSA